MNYITMLYHLFCLKKNVKKSKAEILELQRVKLQKLLKYAYEHSSYYRQTFEQAGFHLDDLQKISLSELPTMDKDQLMEHFDEVVTVSDLHQKDFITFDENPENVQATYRNQYHIVHSSGSTGTPRYFVYDEEAWEQMLLGIIRGALWGMSMSQILKLLIKRPRILYIAATDRYPDRLNIMNKIMAYKPPKMYLKQYDKKNRCLDVDRFMDEVIDEIKKMNEK